MVKSKIFKIQHFKRAYTIYDFIIKTIDISPFWRNVLKDKTTTAFSSSQKSSSLKENKFKN